MATTATTTTSPSGRASAPRPRLVDAALGALIAAPVLAQAFVRQHGHVGWDVAAALCSFGLLVIRRRWPLPALGAALAAAVLFTAVASRPTAILPTAVVLLFNVAHRHDRRTAVWAGVAGLGAFLVCIAIVAAHGFLGPELLAGLAWPALAVAAGDAVRSRREAIAAAEERAERAERSRDTEARRRVAEERLHIARELHDVVAHRIAVVNVQAGVAAHLLRRDPDRAEAALATVRSSARSVLDELATILGVLRAEGEEDSPLEPAPNLEEVPALVASFVQAGLQVRFETTGSPRPVPASTALTAYRTVQEGLTNAHKHGDGTAHLHISLLPDAIEITVDNPAGPPASPGSGFGLLGMRERVAAVGGTVSAGPDGAGRFRVQARLPVGAMVGRP